ncbi:MAG: hypothetical protein IH999_07730 [Proteobacteria bacterium]|nr:hypothetical protein [Pseudomonadota bacterium]
MCEIAKLATNAIGPLRAVKEIIAQPIDNYEKSGDAIPWVCVFALEHCLHQSWFVVASKLQPEELLGGSAVSKVAFPEVSEAFSEGSDVQPAVAFPPLHQRQDRFRGCSIAQGLGFEEAPKQRELHYRLAILTTQLIETRSFDA